MIWPERFLALRISGLGKDAPRPRRIPRIRDEKVRAVIESTLHSKPSDATHWSTLSMSRAQEIGESSVLYIWRQHNLKPPLTKLFKLSRDKRLVERLIDILYLYLNPSDKSLVFFVDDQSQIQALDRIQSGLPFKEAPAEQ